jgi:hypothetical protein
MQGLVLTARNSQPIVGEALLASNNLNNGLSTGTNLGILAGMLAFVRSTALVALRLSYYKGWL